ncbi:hypothetical protein [Corynebacterium silvaticum]|uniref:Uncharacterized protein n=1 Tax=Corynebacterium silvaticum TaxID=2320431 RepID=A0A7Y4P7S7_9CORY|nr:hypothetical protein [Corynebacterium silvaticum]ARU46733.1 hypothetical protein CBE74_10035 [Corynebacterium silvaticum]MBH5300888.1 hypothetical protein [Corynebacterium silvaticum]NOM65087.1 hypothetical protein [Corynebacterium silvaticum]NON70033.1 hypothetical protein [Corynebacterium silvaticum]TFA91647.1 hypothetical protein EU802_10100 [Corynebacterium silvaticum]
MSNPTFETGYLTREAGKAASKFRLVKSVEGKIEHAGANALPFGAVTEAAAPAPSDRDNDLTHGLPKHVRVHTGRVVVPIETAEKNLTVDTKVYAAADGKVAKSGTVGVGIAVSDVKNGLVKVSLFHPAGLGA